MIVSNNFTMQQAYSFQKALMKLQVGLEDQFNVIASMVTDKDVVVLNDRGLLDGSAYVSDTLWQGLLDDMNVNIPLLRDTRYDAIIHMVSAAEGAEEFYAGLNSERYESIEEAKEKDHKLQAAYMGHRNWCMISNNYSEFKLKIKAALQSVLIHMGIEAGNHFLKKFLLKSADDN